MIEICKRKILLKESNFNQDNVTNSTKHTKQTKNVKTNTYLKTVHKPFLKSVRSFVADKLGGFGGLAGKYAITSRNSVAPAPNSNKI